MKRQLTIISDTTHQLFEDAKYGAVDIPQRYKDFYHKSKYALVKCMPNRDEMIDEFCKEYDDSYPHYVPKQPLICLNNRDNLTSYIRTHECNQVYLFEANTVTASAAKLSYAIEQWCKKNLQKELLSITGDDIGDNDIGSKKLIDFNVHDPLQKGIAPTIQFWIPFFSKDFNDTIKASVKDLVDIGERFGYDYQNARREDVVAQPLDEDVCLFTVTFEAKYVEHSFDIGKHVFHASPAEFYPSIRSNGLVPSCKSIHFRYSPRVFMFNSEDMKLIKKYGMKKLEDTSTKNVDSFCIYKIDTEKFTTSPEYSSGQIKVYIDSAFDAGEQNPFAIFTYQPIPLKFIDDSVLVVKYGYREIISEKVISMKEVEKV